MIYIVSFIFTQSIYINAENKYENQTKISGVVCQTPQETDYAFTPPVTQQMTLKGRGRLLENET